MTNILKKFFYGKLLSTNYTAQKKAKTDDKKAFKDTSFSILFEGMIITYKSDVIIGAPNLCIFLADYK